MGGGVAGSALVPEGASRPSRSLIASAASGSLQDQARQLAQLASSFKLNANQAQAGQAPMLMNG